MAKWQWRSVLQSDEAADDSDKALTVPTGKEWRVLSIRVELTATATVGTRQLEVEYRDAANDILWSLLGGTVAASGTLIEQYAPVGGDVVIPEGIILPAGFNVRVFDNAVIDVAADDMIIQMLVEERDAATAGG